MKRNPATLREANFEATVTGFEFFLEIREEIKVGPAWTIGSLGQPGLLGAWASLASCGCLAVSEVGLRAGGPPERLEHHYRAPGNSK